VDKNVPNEQFRYMRDQLTETRFRPRIFDGELVSTENLMIHQTFQVIGDRPVKSDISVNQPHNPATSILR
jgi:hypothetical protein